VIHGIFHQSILSAYGDPIFEIDVLASCDDSSACKNPEKQLSA
jgi:hypothetical protein